MFTARDHEQEIRRMAADKYSGGDIATTLGLTRNQVAGFCHSRKIKLCSIKTKSQVVSRPEPATGSGGVKPENKPKACELMRRPDFREAEPTPLVLFSEFISGCRFPVGEPKSRDFKFCGNPCLGSFSYCGSHVAITHMKQKRPASTMGHGIPSVERVG